MFISYDLLLVQAENPTIVTLGTFDGVHLGHEQLIKSTVESAHEKGMRSVLVTFFPHPRVVLGRAAPFYLTSNAERFARMERLGLDQVVVCKFTLELAQLSAGQFVSRLVQHLQMREMHIGYDFCLGKEREGNASALRELGTHLGYTVHVTDPVRLDELPISSSRIRQSLQAGDIRQANACLGRPFRISGRIFNTWHDPIRHQDVAMIALDKEHAIPSAGAYAAHARIDGMAGLHRVVVEPATGPMLDSNMHLILVHFTGLEAEVSGHYVTLDLIKGAPLNVRTNIPSRLAHHQQNLQPVVSGTVAQPESR